MALLRFLRLLSTTDWLQQPLLLRLNNDLTPEKQAAALSGFRTERERRPALCLVTPYDDRGDAWTRERPTKVVLHHIQVCGMLAGIGVKGLVQCSFWVLIIMKLSRPRCPASVCRPFICRKLISRRSMCDRAVYAFFREFIKRS